MARSTPATQAVPDEGAVVALTAPNADGDTVTLDGSGVFAVVANASGGSINVTLSNPQAYNGLNVEDRVVAVAAGATKHIPIPAFFKQSAGTTDLGVDVSGKVLINYSAVASVTRGIARFGA